MSLIRKPPGAAARPGGPLIRKPDVEVFRDSAAVQVVRGTRAVAVEGTQAVFSAAAKLWGGMILLVFILTGLGAIAGADSWRGVFALPLIVGAVWALVRLFRAPKRTDEAIHAGTDDVLRNVSVPVPAHLRPSLTGATDDFHADYWPRALTEKAAVRGVIGFVLMLTGALSLLGVYLLVRAVLIVSPLLGDRRCVVAGAEGLTVISLLGRKTVPWDRIDSVALHTFGWRSQWVSLSTGSRRHVVVGTVADFERRELLIPYQLLGLDGEGAKRLAARIQERAVAARGAPAAKQPAPARAAPSPSYAGAPEATFDPDAIMARYLAEREQIAAHSQMPRPAGAPRSFGRKGLAAGR